MIGQKEFIEQMDMKNELKDQENQITSKIIRILYLFNIYIIYLINRYLY